jgi:hypothetical protein
MPRNGVKLSGKPVNWLARPKSKPRLGRLNTL